MVCVCTLIWRYAGGMENGTSAGGIGSSLIYANGGGGCEGSMEDVTHATFPLAPSYCFLEERAGYSSALR